MAEKPSQQKTEKHHRKRENKSRNKKIDGPNRPST